MQPTLSDDVLERITGRLKLSLAGVSKTYPGESGRRQPVHTVYGGAHLFKSDTAVRLGQLGQKAFAAYAADADVLGAVLDVPKHIRPDIYHRIRNKLASEAVEDFRIDFEDGYGTRADDEEDGHAESAAREVAKGMTDGTLPPFIGIRI